MVRLTLSSYLTRGHSAILDQQINSTHEGQAHFGNTGPFGATCGDCIFLGYHQNRRNKAGDSIGATYRGGCHKFYELTNKHGPIVPANASACKYFERKAPEENK
jgi:hypothetical protein